MPRAIISTWWRHASTRAIVLVLTLLAILDSAYTSMWISQRGLAGEVNPLIRSLFEVGLGPIWLIGNVVVTFLGAVFLGSCVVLLAGRARSYPIVGMSLLAALKVELGLYHLIQFYGTVEFTWILWITATAAFLATRALLDKGRLIDWGSAARALRQLRSDFSTFIVFSRAPKAASDLETRTEPIRVSQARTTDRAHALRNWRLFFWIGVIILAPIVALSIVQLVLQASGVLELPRWMRGLGMVSEQQGRLFLVSLITVILTIAILIYGIVAVFEIFSEESTRKRRRAGLPRNRRFLRRFAIRTLILTLAFISIPTVFATSKQIQSVSDALASCTGPEIAAVADSKGLIHAVWVEHSDLLAGNVSLWYSTYDPESTSARSARLIGSSASICSLDTTIDERDNVHVVWVSEATENASDTEHLKEPERGSSISQLWYQGINSSDVFSPSPTLLFSFQGDSVSVSVAPGNELELYLAWIEVLQLDSSRIESSTYYGKLNVHDGTANVTRTLVAKTLGPSGMLKAITPQDRRTLHLAWSRAISNYSSCITYSKVDLSQNAATTLDVECVNGTIGRLTLAATLNGDVRIGWVYEDKEQNRPIAHVARLSRDRNATLSELETPSRRLADIESMTLDFDGNLHLLWIDHGDDLRAGPTPVPPSSSRLRYAEYSGSSQPSEVKQEVFYLSVMAAFVIGNGQVYVVSQGGLVEAKPVSATSPWALLLLLIGLASATAGMSTEAGAYLVVRKAIAPWSKRKLVGDSFSNLDMRLLRKIARRPGITLFELGSIVRGSTLDVASRLWRLEASGIVGSLREGTRRRFYCLASSFFDGSSADRLRSSILRLVEEEPGINEAAIASRLVLSQQLTNYHLKLLTEARLLLALRANGRVSYHVDKRIRR